MSRLSIRAQALYLAADEASDRRIIKPRGQSREVLIHQWLAAEIRFADEVGIGFVQQPQKVPVEDWQCRAYKSIAEALQLIRQKQYGAVVRSNA
jgi:hypothetical protein